MAEAPIVAETEMDPPPSDAEPQAAPPAPEDAPVDPPVAAETPEAEAATTEAAAGDEAEETGTDDEISEPLEAVTAVPSADPPVEPPDDAEGEAGPEEEVEIVPPEEDPMRSIGYELRAIQPDSMDAPPVSLNGLYTIHPSKPLPGLDSPSAWAFEVDDVPEREHKLFALICIPELPVRSDVMDIIAGVEYDGNILLIDYGTVDWPILGQKTMAVILERPMGGRLSEVMEAEGSEYTKVDYIRLALNTIMEALGHLSTRAITHRAIRHDNMFFIDESRTELVLGEFVTSPHGFDQPVAYETIERSMADEGGRGAGINADDMYALGVTLAFLCQKTSPVEGVTKEELVIAKISESSYQALINKPLITATMLDLLRGLLNDDPVERWSFEEIELWMSGRRVPPTQSSGQPRSQRPLKFGDHEHVVPRTLAHAMAKRPESAIKMIKDGSIEQWAARGLEDKELAATIAAHVETDDEAEETTADDDQMLLTRILLILDPLAPVRYKGVSYMPDAFGPALAIERLRTGDIKILAESIIKDIPQIWYQVQAAATGGVFVEDPYYAKVKAFLQKVGPGHGVERCLYQRNPGLACQSPLIKESYVLSIEDLLPSLDAAEKTVDTKTAPIDRHIAAFIASRVTSSIDSMLNDLADPDDALKAVGTLKLLAHLQGRHGPDSLLGLSKWIGGQMGPVIKLYQSRITRKELEGEIPALVRKGHLPTLLKLLDNPQRRLIDDHGYSAAVAEFRVAADEIFQIEDDLDPASGKADKTAKQVAAVTSISIMTLVITLLIIAS